MPSAAAASGVLPRGLEASPGAFPAAAASSRGWSGHTQGSWDLICGVFVERLKNAQKCSLSSVGKIKTWRQDRGGPSTRGGRAPSLGPPSLGLVPRRTRIVLCGEPGSRGGGGESARVRAAWPKVGNGECGPPCSSASRQVPARRFLKEQCGCGRCGPRLLLPREGGHQPRLAAWLTGAVHSGARGLRKLPRGPHLWRCWSAVSGLPGIPLPLGPGPAAPWEGLDGAGRGRVPVGSVVQCDSYLLRGPHEALVSGLRQSPQGAAASAEGTGRLQMPPCLSVWFS